jgi:hypothetical protein
MVLKSARDYERAIARDPNDAQATARLADTCALPGLAVRGDGPHRGVPLAKAAAIKALELDSTLGDSRHGFCLDGFDWDFESAERIPAGVELSKLRLAIGMRGT